MLALVIAQAQVKTVSPVTLALITTGGALLGVVLGGVLGALMNMWAESRRIARDARVGARLVRVDLSLAASHLQDAQESGLWWAFFDTRIGAWEQYRAALADR